MANMRVVNNCTRPTFHSFQTNHSEAVAKSRAAHTHRFRVGKRFSIFYYPYMLTENGNTWELPGTTAASASHCCPRSSSAGAVGV